MASTRRMFSTRRAPVLAHQRVYQLTAARTSAVSSLATSIMGASSSGASLQMLCARRFNATNEAKPGASAKGAEGEAGTKHEGGEKAEGSSHNTTEEQPPKLSSFAQLKADVALFPDIYNAPNMLMLALFFVFCLNSTGTEKETEWWLKHWGVDGDSAVWSWALHGLLTNQVTATIFAMILFHPLALETTKQIGTRAFLAYVAVVTVASGASIWASNKAFPEYFSDKQFGPWDSIAALFVMQYLAVGTTPWGLILSYRSWVRYANVVGAIAICYFDPQPLFWGTLYGLALTKGRVFKPIAAAAA